MSDQPDRRLTRRAVLRLGSSAVAGGVAGSVLGWTVLAGPSGRAATGRPAAPPRVRQPAAVTHTVRLVATDGFMSYPGRRTPQGNTTGDFGDPGDGVYSFGFRGADAADLGGADPFTAPVGDLVPPYKGRVHNPAPTIALESDADVFITMSNLGFEGRPDLDDAHTIHWHGFRQQVAIFDGVPEASISVPPLRDFPYYFPTRGVGFEGTYIYHCHFEDTEHVQMGMDGVVFIRPPDTGVKRAYDDPSTAFHREFALLLNEIDVRPHDNLIAVQEFIWSEYDAQYYVINGRSYPDTVAANGALGAPATTPDGFPLPLQPVSSLIQAAAGEQVLIRLTNLGYYQHSMQLAGIPMTVVGHDATYLTTPYVTNTIDIGPGETRDAIFTAPAHSGGIGPDVYLFKNRNLDRLVNGPDPANLAVNGLGGMATEVHVHPPGTLPPQTLPNELVAP